MKAIRKAHEVDFWVWKKEWSKRQAAVELDKFFHEINATLDILVPFGEPRYLYINNHCYILPDEIVVYDEGRIYKYFHDDINSEAFIKRYSFEKQETPCIEETGLFPFTVENIEDFHKKYLWYEGYDEEWEWNEEGFKSFSLWAKEHDIQFARDTWDKEKHEDLLKFPMYTNRHNIVIQLILRPGDILHYSHDKRASGEFPFSIGCE